MIHGSVAKEKGFLLRRCVKCGAMFHGDYYAQHCPKHKPEPAKRKAKGWGGARAKK
jgi:hypothetical protein